MQWTRDSSASLSGLDMREIAREHYDSVFRFCARRLGPDRAADVSQETFLTAQKVLKSFRGESSVKSWLLGIALNECRRQMRKAPLEYSGFDYAFEDGAQVSPENTWATREAIRSALSKLSHEHRDVVLLHEVDGLTYEEAATVLGIPSGTVKSRLHHAFINLRSMLAQAENVR